MSFHITRVASVADDEDANVERYQAVCIREDCQWSSDLWETQRGAEEAAHCHESNGDRFATGEHPAIEEDQ